MTLVHRAIPVCAALIAALAVGQVASAQDRKASARAFLEKELPGSVVILENDPAELTILSMTFTDQCTLSVRVTPDGGASYTRLPFDFRYVRKLGTGSESVFFRIQDLRANIYPSVDKPAENWEFTEALEALYEDGCMPKD
ncbi:MAG: hypothetical protein EOP60_13175 [Sphingomonadales bacterium]|nr:MAG: hypothetical protein EOP60_13175 [Sphingomonadales bacterium]